ncbi:hypothetical protein TRFO_26160 [Tritrichomonas foetus]|uniref:Protein kinase domain-containing protein n=1 Tax=Tritrichomonas foetus TaxID=1144522 RepID=A0A1J4K4P7_9EUKA|nr:hypothetical protein TRFO_26160 [Tritrichomonas foetus]|eukprot:OHT05946.1 hypothetical protein TRFO_26160 [Tritrichomonas foetus]
MIKSIPLSQKLAILQEKQLEIFSAGNNAYCQLGRDGDWETPKRIIFPNKNFVRISAGYSHCVVLFEDKTVFAWGNNHKGCIGFPTDIKEVKVPTKINGLPLICDVQCGFKFTLFLTIEKKVLISSQHNKGLFEQINIGESARALFGFSDPWIVGQSDAVYWVDEKSKNVLKYGPFPGGCPKQILSIGQSTIVVTASGEALEMKKTSRHYLGIISKVFSMNEKFEPIESLKGVKIKKVSGIDQHILALSEDDQVFVWGKNLDGQLGFSDRNNRFDGFVRSTIYGKEKIIDVAAGYDHSILIDSSGRVWGLGSDYNGQTMLSGKGGPLSLVCDDAVAAHCGFHFSLIVERYFTHTQVISGSSQSELAKIRLNQEVNLQINRKAAEITQITQENNEVSKKHDIQVIYESSSSLTKEKSKLIKEINNLKKDNRTLREENFDLKKANLTFKQDNDNWKKIIRELKEENTKLKEENLISKERCLSFREENVRLKNQLSQYEDKIQLLEETLSQSSNHIKSLHMKNESLKELKQEYDIITESIKIKDSEIGHLYKHIQNLENQIKISTFEEHDSKTLLWPTKIIAQEEIENLHKIKKIGHGISSVVMKVSREELYALKILDLDVLLETNENEEEQCDDTKMSQLQFDKIRNFLKEYEIMTNICHPNIIKSHGICYGDSKNPPSILLEYCSHTLKTYITKLSEEEIEQIIKEIIEGMSYIHQCGIIHRDLKPENILLDSDKHVKICDFGVSTLSSDSTHTGGVGTLVYMSPEQLNNEVHYTNKIDVYAFGIVLYFLLTRGSIPAISISNISQGKSIPLPSDINDFYRTMIERCLSFDPKNRPPFSELSKYIQNK